MLKGSEALDGLRLAISSSISEIVNGDRRKLLSWDGGRNDRGSTSISGISFANL